MRIAVIGLGVLALATIPAGACPNEKSARAHAFYTPSDMGGDTIRKVMRGERMAVACDGVDLEDGEVRVVLNFSADWAKELGYKGVLATDQVNDDGEVKIRVPDAPDMANHTMNVKVFVLHGSSTEMCDAGKVRVG
jgi:hypothetical protein